MPAEGRELNRRISEAVRLAKGRVTMDLAPEIAKSLPPEIRDALVVASVSRALANAISKSRAADPRQGWLALPEYEHIPVVVMGETLEQYREGITKLEAKIAGYQYARRSPGNMESDKLELRERKRLLTKIKPFFAGNPSMTVGLAGQMLQESIQKPLSVHMKKQSAGALKARYARTKNQ